MVKLDEAIKKAHRFTGLSMAFYIWETQTDYLFYMVPADTPTDEAIEIGMTLTSISKQTGKADLYNILDHPDFMDADLIREPTTNNKEESK